MESIGLRMRSFGKFAYGTISAFASAMQMKPPALHPYLENKTEPGTKIIMRLWFLGCDCTWLLTGKGNMFAANERGETLERKQLQEQTSAYENDVTQDESTPSWRFAYKKAFRDGNDSQRKHLTEFVQILLGEALDDTPETAKDKLALLACKLVYEGMTTEQVRSILTTKQKPQAEEDKNNFPATSTIEPSYSDLFIDQNRYRKIALLRQWLTDTGEYGEWYNRIKEYDHDLKFDDVLAWEGVVLRPGDGNQPSGGFFSFLHAQGVNVDWLFGDGVEPFSDREQANFYRQRVFGRGAPPQQELSAP